MRNDARHKKVATKSMAFQLVSPLRDGNNTGRCAKGTLKACIQCAVRVHHDSHKDENEEQGAWSGLLSCWH
jgi:hypothetical protein